MELRFWRDKSPWGSMVSSIGHYGKSRAKRYIPNNKHKAEKANWRWHEALYLQ